MWGLERCLRQRAPDSLQPKAADAMSPLIHTRFLGMDLDAALKTQINLALANALLGVKSADVSADAIGELVTAGVSLISARHNRKRLINYTVSSTAAPVIRQQVCLTQRFTRRFQFTLFTPTFQLFIFLLEWATESMSRQGIPYSI